MKAADVKNGLVWDWMKPELVTVRPEETVEQAVLLMQKLGIHHLVVMDGNKYIGLVDSRDCACVWEKNKPVSTLSHEVPIVEEDTEVSRVVELILSRRYTALPLRWKGEIRGIITSTDLLQLLNFQLHAQPSLHNLVDSGKALFSKPIIQSLMHALESAGL